MRHLILSILILFVCCNSSKADDSAKESASDTSAIRKLFDQYFKHRQSNPVAALNYLSQAQEISERLGLDEKTGWLIYHKGYMYRMLGVNNLAIRSYLRALQFQKHISDSGYVAWLLIDIGNLYFTEKNKLPVALKQYQRAEEIFRQIKNKEGVIVACYNTGLTYRDKGEHALAIKKFREAVVFSKEMRHDYNEALSLSYIGQVYVLLDSMDQALNYFDQSFEINKAKNFVDGMGYCYANYASAFLKQNKWDAAIENYFKSLELYKKTNDKLNISLTLNSIAHTYGEQSKYKEALGYALQSLKIADSNLLYSTQKQVLPQISLYYSKLDDHKAALEYKDRYVELLSSELNKSSDHLQMAYEAELSQKELLIYKNEIAHNLSKIKLQNIIIYSSVAVLLVLAGLLWMIFARNRELKSSHALLYKSYAELHQKESGLAEVKRPKRALTAEQNQQISDQLFKLMQEEKIYLNGKLTIDDLAKRLNTNRTYLSQIINEQNKANFNAYINEFRIKEAQRLLLDHADKEYSIEGIATQVGFSSKSTFNAAFKKFTGLTPTEFTDLRDQS